MFVAFGSLVLVPLLTGLDPSIALFTAGAGTLIFQICTKGKVPVFLASSFAFIAPISYGVQTWGIPGTLCGLAASGIVYVVLSFAIRIRGSEFLETYLPRVVTGPVIMVIGLILAPVGVNLALGRSGDGAIALVPQGTAIALAAIALITTVVVTLLGRGLIRIVPILLGAVVGYAAALVLMWFGVPNVLDFSPITAAPWFSVPNFVFPEWNLQAIIFILPVSLAPAIEHFGDILAIRDVTGRNYVRDPGLQPRDHDLGGDVGDRLFLHREARRRPSDDSDSGHGRHSRAALWSHHGCRSQQPDERTRQPHETAQPDHCVDDPSAGHRWYGDPNRGLRS